MFRFKLLLSSICISLLCFGLYCSSAFSATLIIDEITGQLMGATGVVVADETYDVEFIDGTAYDIYLPYTTWVLFEGFIFDTMEEAFVASQALLDQVLIGQFDVDLALTNGIADTPDLTAIGAQILTPFDITFTATDVIINTVAAENYENDESDRTWMAYYTMNSQFHDTSSSPYEVYTRWTPNATTHTPEPTTILLLGIGLISLAGLRRKKYFNKA